MPAADEEDLVDRMMRWRTMLSGVAVGTPAYEASLEMDAYLRERQFGPPLFIPLHAKYFAQFEDGSKLVEYRPYGPRWNEKTCRVGRRVTLSLGYGKQRRLHGRIVGFSVTNWTRASEDFRKLFPFEVQSACIRLALDPRPEK